MDSLDLDFSQMKPISFEEALAVYDEQPSGEDVHIESLTDEEARDVFDG